MNFPYAMLVRAVLTFQFKRNLRMFFLRLITLLLINISILCASEEAKPFGSQKSWIASANDPTSDFPLQNLPYGLFNFQNKSPRICVAIGDYALDLKACADAGLLDDIPEYTRQTLQKDILNDFMALDAEQHVLVRQRIIELLQDDTSTIKNNLILRNRLLHLRSDIEMLMPVQIGDYTDFYASIHHALHVGSIMRPDNPLMPNYKHMPIGYHGRSSSVVVSGASVFRPSGQTLNKDGVPVLSSSQSLDYELEMGAIIGKGNLQGSSIVVQDAQSHIFGYVLLNDWSARDIQKWEYQPLGPFNGKNFATSISPWIVTAEALKPFQKTIVRGEKDPQLLPYLDQKPNLSFDVIVEAWLSSEKMRNLDMEPILICKGNASELYWSFDQMVCHHTAGGCNLRTGDLLGSGTISGAAEDSLGCLLERIAFKLPSLELPDGTSRNYLGDGDEIILRAYTEMENYPRIGFGECRGIITRPSL